MSIDLSSLDISCKCVLMQEEILFSLWHVKP
nr:MAG TPA: hypothetical protein [Caudoviricetes sp.]